MSNNKLQNEIICELDNYIKFLFLCGKSYKYENDYKSTNRFYLEEFINNYFNQNQNIFIVLAENIWNDEFLSDIDLLTFEDILCEFSNKIVLFCESYGTFAEIGAFSSNDDLSKKMIVYVDKKYKQKKSFLINGPIELCKKNKSKILYKNIFNNDFIDKDTVDWIHELLGIKEITLLMKTYNDHIKNNKSTTRIFVLQLIYFIYINVGIFYKDEKTLFEIIKLHYYGNGIINFEPKNRNINMNHIIKILEKLNILKTQKFKNSSYLTINNNSSVYKFLNSKLKIKDISRNICRELKYRKIKWWKI